MPAVPSWNAEFLLTNPYNGTMQFNVQTDAGLYLLERSACKFGIDVRSTDSNVPQGDGGILHRRFLTKTSMPLRIYLMENNEDIACDDLLTEMLDALSGAFRSLLNAGDNEGRLAWAVAGGNERMLDDVRCLVYPSFEAGDVFPYVDTVLDSRYPYAQDLNQTRTTFADGVPQDITNTGSAGYWPVFQANRSGGVAGGSSVDDFTISNLTTGIDFVYTSSNPGAIAVAAGSYAEIDTFGNTIYRNGNLTDLAAGISELESDYWPLITGEQTILISGCDMDMLWAPAWG